MNATDDNEDSSTSPAEFDRPGVVVLPVDNRGLADLPCNDVGNAKRLVARFGLKLRHSTETGWHVFDGRRWQRSLGQRNGPGAEVMKAAQATADAIALEADSIADEVASGDSTDKSARNAIADRIRRHRAFGIRSGNHGRLLAMLAQAEPFLKVSMDAFDTDPMLLNVTNGTIDLSADEITVRNFDRSDMLTKMSPVTFDANADAPVWQRFLKRVLPDVEVRTFLQRWLGYCLSGSTAEQRLLIAYGTGANGKSVLFRAVEQVLGDYALTVAIQTFLQDSRRGGGDATPDLARLAGPRLVLAAEPEVGARLNESLIKVATGGDRMVARHLFGDTFEFTPRFKLVLLANVRPSVRGQDRGIWRRILLVPIDVTIDEEERDPTLLQRLVTNEAAAILNWLIDGWRQYREVGLAVPQVVLNATAAYRSDSDSAYEFMNSCVIVAEGERVRAGKLYEAYRQWCLAGTSEPVTLKRFGSRLNELGYAKLRIGGAVQYLDIVIVEGSIPDASDQDGKQP